MFHHVSSFFPNDTNVFNCWGLWTQGSQWRRERFGCWILMPPSSLLGKSNRVSRRCGGGKPLQAIHWVRFLLYISLRNYCSTDFHMRPHMFCWKMLEECSCFPCQGINKLGYEYVWSQEWRCSLSSILLYILLMESWNINSGGALWPSEGSQGGEREVTQGLEQRWAYFAYNPFSLILNVPPPNNKLCK